MPACGRISQAPGTSETGRADSDDTGRCENPVAGSRVDGHVVWSAGCSYGHHDEEGDSPQHPVTVSIAASRADAELYRQKLATLEAAKALGCDQNMIALHIDDACAG